MKTYSPAPDVDSCISLMLDDYHTELEGVRVSALFVFDTEVSDCVLKHQGYPAQAVARIVPTRDRALGMADANIIVDRSNWLTLSQRQRDALVDHELTHLTRVLDDETGRPLCDVLDRPKLSMRRHDFQAGWFHEIAQRHGDASQEVRSAKQLMAGAGQLYFDFGPRAGTMTPLFGIAPVRDETHVWWQHGISQEKGNGPRCDKPADCVEIDPPAGSPSELVQAAERVAAGAGDGSPDDSADFEAGLAKHVGARKKRGSNVIDGRSERVKHQDSKRDGAH
jgi:hypothetical protein